MLPDLSGLGCCSDSTFAPLLLAATYHNICRYQADLEGTDLPGQRMCDAITGVPSDGDAALSVCTEEASIAMEGSITAV